MNSMSGGNPNVNPYGSPDNVGGGSGLASPATGSTDFQSLLASNPMLALIMAMFGGGGSGTTQSSNPLQQAAASMAANQKGKQAMGAQVTPGDLNAYTGSSTPNQNFFNRAQTLVPFLQDQENAVKSKQAAAQKNWTAAHPAGSQSGTSLPQAPPRWMMNDPSMSSDAQDALLDWHTQQDNAATLKSGTPLSGSVSTPYGPMDSNAWQQFQKDHSVDNYSAPEQSGLG